VRLVAALVGASALAVGAAAAAPLPGAPRCPIFPPASPWNQRVDRRPVARSSDALMRAIGATATRHADCGAGRWQGSPIGIPITVVGGGQPRTRVAFTYADESDPGPYPIPADVRIEGGPRATGDRHALIVERDRCRLDELDALRREGGHRRAGSGAIFDLRSTRLRPPGRTSADAAGRPILPGLARWDEVARGRIDHALCFTAPRTRRAHVWPARHFASEESSWYVSGEPHPRWDDDDLRTLHQVPGSAFEVVDATRLRRR
jgi:hypothetical protein